MDKKDLKKLALLGLTGACLLSTQVAFAEESKTSLAEAAKKNDGNVGYHLYTEEELLLELNPEAVKVYQSLDAAGKKLAREVASQRCNGQNACKGLNGCETDKNECAGKGSCKGLGKCAIADKNLAVKLVAKKMGQKRAGMSGSQ